MRMAGECESEDEKDTSHSIRLTRPLRIALVDDDKNLQHRVSVCFAGPEVGWRVDSYANVAQALDCIQASPPQVVLMDVSPPGLAGIGFVRKLKALLPELPVVIFTAQADMGTLLEAFMAGACGYLIKPAAPCDLVPQIRKALAGRLVISPRAERLLLKAMHGLGRSMTSLGMSRREEDLMLCLCQQWSNKECATALRICPSTVHAHLATIFKKLNVHDRESALHVFIEQLGGGANIARSLRS